MAASTLGNPVGGEEEMEQGGSMLAGVVAADDCWGSMNACDDLPEMAN